jgi:hypothetical protein
MQRRILKTVIPSFQFIVSGFHKLIFSGSDPSNWKESLVLMQQKSKAQNFQKELKEYSGAVSKYGKAIEKVTIMPAINVKLVSRK